MKLHVQTDTPTKKPVKSDAVERLCPLCPFLYANDYQLIAHFSKVHVKEVCRFEFIHLCCLSTSYLFSILRGTFLKSCSMLKLMWAKVSQYKFLSSYLVFSPLYGIWFFDFWPFRRKRSSWRHLCTVKLRCLRTIQRYGLSNKQKESRNLHSTVSHFKICHCALFQFELDDLI